MSETVRTPENQSALVAVLRRMEADGLSLPEMATRVRRRPGAVRRLLDHGERVGASAGSDDVLRPVERVVIDGLEAGDNYGTIASRIGRSGLQTRRIAAYARFKLSGGPLVIGDEA